MLFADRRFNHIVVNCHYQHLHCSDKAFGGFFFYGVMLLIPASAGKESNYEQKYDQPNLQNILCNRNIPRTFYCSVGKSFVDLVVVFGREEETFVVFALMSSFLKSFTAKHVPTAFLSFDNDGKVDTNRFPVPVCNVPLVRVCQMFKNKSRNIDFLFLLSPMRSVSFRGKAGKQESEE